jgi:hypothetical protein
MSQVYDLNKFRKQERVFKLEDKEFIFSKIPFSISCEFYELIPIFTRLEETKKINKDDYLKILKIIYEVFKLSDNTLEFDWLDKQVDMEIFNEIATTIFLAAFDNSKKNTENEEDSLKST